MTTSPILVQIPAASSPDPIERAAVLSASRSIGPVKAKPFGRLPPLPG